MLMEFLNERAQYVLSLLNCTLVIKKDMVVLKSLYSSEIPELWSQILNQMILKMIQLI